MYIYNTNQLADLYVFLYWQVFPSKEITKFIKLRMLLNKNINEINQTYHLNLSLSQTFQIIGSFYPNPVHNFILKVSCVTYLTNYH